ncbi:MAG: site-2 protease family protein [Treponema sp.]|nr:site-2 protease family protein [Treponema sp.]
MTLLNILLGLIGLGIVVFFHELGHFLAARFVGINVEAFSIGWGNPILKKKIGNTEYRLGMFPLGGYCKMQGDSDHNNEAYVNLEKGIAPEKGSYHAASPAARMLVCFCGPLFNLLFAVLVFIVIFGIGFTVHTTGNKIILASDFDNSRTYPADIAGLKTGDRIIEIRGKETNYFHEIRKNIIVNPKKVLPVTVDRNGEILHFQITPSLNENEGSGQIGILTWKDPVIDSIIEDSAAEKAGLMPGDLIVSANGIPIFNSEDFRSLRNESIINENTENFVIEYERYGARREAVFSAEEIKGELGFSWAIITYRTPRLSVPKAIATGVKESYETLYTTVTSLRLLFMGINLTKAVSGPVRITYMIGDTATQGFGQGIGTGFLTIFNFIALISIALCVMNLLPLPILDGGMIILFFIEMIRKKPIPPKAVAAFQTCGFVIIIGLMLFAIFGDIMFFATR